ncbi:MAG: NUDIX domain-containing protein, partial [Candidatus Saccharibacteria bacterium]|nr:NUDIX domain-containing protein [Rhodoferax sp.]
MLTKDVFLSVVDAAPLVAMDLVVVRGGTEILLGLRNNRPAQGFWFVPGGRIRKNEPMQAALARVAQDELGLALASLPQPPVHIGAYEHFYADCFAGDVGVSTHYVVMGNLVQLPAGTELAAADAQHSALRWWPLAEAAQSAEVHR